MFFDKKKLFSALFEEKISGENGGGGTQLTDKIRKVVLDTFPKGASLLMDMAYGLTVLMIASPSPNY